MIPPSTRAVAVAEQVCEMFDHSSADVAENLENGDLLVTTLDAYEYWVIGQQVWPVKEAC